MNLQHSKLSALLSLILGVSLISGCTFSRPDTDAYQTQSILQTHIEDNLIVPVTIGNKTYSFLVDTGASITVIDSSIANDVTDSIELSSLSAHYQKDFENIKTVSGSIENNDITFLKPVPISIGVKTIGDQEVWVSLDIALVSQAVGMNLDGILGIDTFRQMNWLVDNSAQRLTVMGEAPPSAQFDQCIGYSDSYNRSPMLNVNYGNNNISVLVDTGASNGYFGQEFVNHLLHNTQSAVKIPHAALSVDANGFSRTDEYVLSDLEFNGMPIGDIQISGNAGEQYALGMDFFSRFQQYAFMPSKMMFCYNADTIEQEWKKPYRTIYVRYANERLEVFYNPEALITSHGLENGDIILKVNGKTYKPSKIRKLNEMLSYTAKGELSITIQRGDEVKTIQL